MSGAKYGAAVAGTASSRASSHDALPAFVVRVCLLLAALAILPHLAWAATLEGRIVAVADGDTVTLLDAGNRQHRIRLAGIDAPEKAQPFGQRSKQHLAAILFGRDVEADCPKTDRYGRSVCKIVIDGVDASLHQVKAGMAWWYRQYATEQGPRDREDYEAAEFEARAKRSGLWTDKNPMPPWEWRRAR